MCKMKYFAFVLLLACMVIDITGLSEKAMKAAVKMVTNTCQPKTKATTEDVEKMHKGDWDIDHTAKCYMFCALNMYKLLNKDNSLNYQNAMQQLHQLPDTYRDDAKICIDKCVGVVTGIIKDKCEAAYEMSKCMYFCNPEKYFLP